MAPLTSQHKLISGTVAVALIAGGGASLAAVELSSSSPTTAPAVTAPVAAGLGGYGFDAGRRGGRGLGGGVGFADHDAELRERARFFDRAFLGFGVAAAADYLGLTSDTLHLHLAAGTTLARLAQVRGKAVDGLVAAIAAAQRRGVEQAVAAGLLRRAQADRLETSLRARARELVNGRPRHSGRRPS